MLFKLSNISKHYGSESEGTLRNVLDGLSLEVNEGESIAILGPSGSGKTTLLNIMGTLDKPDTGDVFFRKEITPNDNKNKEESLDDWATSKNSGTENILHKHEHKPQADKKSELRTTYHRPIVKLHPDLPSEGKTEPEHVLHTKENDGTGRYISDVKNNFSPSENLVNYSTKELDTFRNQKIGFVFQMHQLLPQCTLLENILIPTLTIKDKKIKAERLSRAKELMERVGIWEHRDQMPGHLSGGECQRAAVVRALINSPGLLLADEPTGALDEDNVSKLAKLLIEINKSYGVTLVIVTHSMALASKMDTVYELKNGKLKNKKLKA